MIWVVNEVIDFLFYNKLPLLLIFLAYVWILFLYKLHLARKYKPYTTAYTASISVVIPVYNEPPRILKNVLNSLKTNLTDLKEIIIGLDYRDKYAMEVLNLYKSEFRNKLRILVIKEKGKRAAVAAGLKKAKGDIAVIMDSDTFLCDSKTISDLIKPFADPMVGGVSTNQRVNMNPHNDLKKRFSDWMESMRCHLSFPAMSVKGVVGCLPGRCIAFRRELLLPHLDTEFLNETFRGVKCETGDDRCLTHIVLRQGYKAVFQSTARVLTEVPSTWKGFLKQQLRWIRSSRRETLSNLKWMVKKPFILPFIFISDIIIPVFFSLVILNTFVWFSSPLAIESIFSVTFLQSIISAFVIAPLVVIISIGLRQMPHLKKNLKDLKILPLYILYCTLILTPLCIYGLITTKEQAWMTRRSSDAQGIPLK
jgi:hyaluronan synthase